MWPEDMIWASAVCTKCPDHMMRTKEVRTGLWAATVAVQMEQEVVGMVEACAAVSIIISSLNDVHCTGCCFCKLPCRDLRSCMCQ